MPPISGMWFAQVGSLTCTTAPGAREPDQFRAEPQCAAAARSLYRDALTAATGEIRAEHEFEHARIEAGIADGALR